MNVGQRGKENEYSDEEVSQNRSNEEKNLIEISEDTSKTILMG